ncbi:MAG: hypothetical protein K2O18_00295 [Oscillospiraceae bacterium]|nr:hypothetical protein [Oscillospiraceae bacterium]
MSYTIEYKRQFIKSQEGITPCWLAGDNNLYEGSGRNERRAREWCCFHNLAGVTELEILDAVQPSLGGHEDHWMRNGKWVDDEGLIRWIKSGCKSAATVGEILKENPHLQEVRCYAYVWEAPLHRIELDYCVWSTDEFDRWIRLYRTLHSELTAKGCSVYPVIDLGTESRYRQPGMSKKLSESYILKHKQMYVTGVTEDTVSWNRDIQKAAVFTGREIIRLREEHFDLWAAQAIRAETKERPCNAVIMFEDGQYGGRYDMKRTKSRLLLSSSIEAAKHYSTAKAAEKAAAKMQAVYGKHGKLAVRIHTNSN